MKKLLGLVSSLMVFAMVLTACSTSGPPVKEESKAPEASTAAPETPEETEAPPAAEGVKGMKFASIFKNTGNPTGEKMQEGFKEAIEQAGGEAILKAPDLPTAEAQIQMIEELIAQNVAAIAISANDPDALQPALEKARSRGIQVLSYDSAVNAQSRAVNIDPADPVAIGKTLVEAAFDMCGGSGEFAILSATSQATNQNIWIENMKTELQDPKYKDLVLVKVAYGDDLRDKSVSETEALLKSYPDLKCIVAPTTVGIAAAGKVLTDKGLKDKVKLTGLGLPSEMAEYINNGVCPYMYLWNPIDIGYAAGCAAISLVEGTVTGKEGDVLKAGRLGDMPVVTVGDGTQIYLGNPFKFEPANIEEWKTVY